MRVKLLLYVQGLEEGGTERQVERLARGLNGSRFQTAVAYSRSWGPVGERLRLAGIPVVRFSDRDAAEAESVIRGIAPGIFHSFTHKDTVDIAAATAGGTPLVMASRRNMREWDEHLEVRPWELAQPHESSNNLGERCGGVALRASRGGKTAKYRGDSQRRRSPES